MTAWFLLLVVLVIPLGVRAHTQDTAVVAIMKLAEEANYSWSCNVTDDARSYDIEGRTDGGFTWQRQPMPKIIARRLGRAAGHDLESIFSAPLRYVILTEAGWMTLDELPKQHSDWSDGEWYYPTITSSSLRTADMPADATSVAAYGLPPAIWIPAVPEEDSGKVYSNAQFALALPHEELGIMVSSHLEFNVEGNVVTGTLSDMGAQLLLVHDGHEYIKPVAAGGRFRIWLGAELVEKFSVELAGVMVVDRKPVYVRQQSTTTVRAVGSTKVEVPPDARRRL